MDNESRSVEEILLESFGGMIVKTERSAGCTQTYAFVYDTDAGNRKVVSITGCVNRLIKNLQNE